jgi:hypothetical protein
MNVNILSAKGFADFQNWSEKLLVFKFLIFADKEKIQNRMPKK